MLNFSFIVFYYYLFDIIESKKILKLPLIRNYGTYDIEISINNKPFKYFELNMLAEYIWINKFFTNEDEEVIYSPNKEEMILFNTKVEAKKDSPSLTFNIKDNITVNSFPLYYIVEYSNNFYDTLPLAFKFSNESYSLIHFLKKNNYIDNKGFGIIYNKDNISEASLYLGGFPNEFSEGKSLTVKVNESFSSWGFTLYKIKISSYIYKVEQYSFFQTKEPKILVPIEFYNFLRKNILNEYIMDEYCYYVNSVNGEQFVCICSQIEDFPNITFIFNNIQFSFTKNDLFSSLSDRCVFNIVLNHSNDWVLGITFLSKYHTYFDYDTKSIIFYHKLIVKTKKTQLFYTTINIIILSLTTILLIIKVKR